VSVRLYSIGRRLISVSRIEQDGKVGPDMPETDGEVEAHNVRKYRLNAGKVEFVRVLGKDLQRASTSRLAGAGYLLFP